MVNKVKSLLFKLLKLNGYLSVTQKGYLLGLKSGLLKTSPSYQWHYFVKKLLQPGDFVLDIGANLGYFTTQFLGRVQPSGHLYCIEPVAPFRKQLEKLTAGKSNVTVLPYALGEENDKKVTLGIPSQFEKLGYLRHGTTTLLHGNQPEAKFSFEATMKRGSNLFADLPRLDYIKCDIEGYETVVLPEMQSILEKYKPMVQLETWGEQLLLMHRFFTGLDYKAFFLKNEKLYPLETKNQKSWGESDILFVPSSKIDRIKLFCEV